MTKTQTFDPPAAPEAQDDLAQLIATLKTINAATGWNGTQRTMLTSMALNAQLDPATGYRVLENSSAAKIAKLTGINENTVDETIRLFLQAEPPVIQRHITDVFYDKKGRQIDRKQYNKAAGHKWFSEVVFAIPPLLEDLPKLAESSTAQKAKAKRASERKELADLREKAQKIADGKLCPNCGQSHSLIVTLEATCTACGCKVDEQELGNCADADPSQDSWDTPSPEYGESSNYTPESWVGSGSNTEGGK